MATREFPSLDLIRQSLREENGRLFWLARPEHHFANKRAWNSWNTKYAGKESGCISRHGRHVIGFNGKLIFRSVVVWAMHHGGWPTHDVDHKNRDSLDDRIDNLRPATRSQNNANSRIYSNNTSGFKGVKWSKKYEKWEAGIKVNRKSIYLGMFDNLREACEARAKASKELHGEYSYDGKS